MGVSADGTALLGRNSGIGNIGNPAKELHRENETELHRTAAGGGCGCGSDRRCTDRGGGSHYWAVLQPERHGNYLPVARQCSDQRRPAPCSVLPLRRRSLPALNRLKVADPPSPWPARRGRPAPSISRAPGVDEDRVSGRRGGGDVQAVEDEVRSLGEQQRILA